MDKKVWERSNFYRQRINHYPRIIIIPLLVFVILGLLFLVLAPRETTVSITGKLASQHQVPLVQTHKRDQIKHNYLRNDAQVKKGQTLLVYRSFARQQQLKDLQWQNQVLNEQITNLKTLTDSVQQNKNLFNQNHSNNYADLYQSYAQRRQVYVLQNDFAMQPLRATKTQIEHDLSFSQQTYRRHLRDLQKLQQAIRQGKTLSKNNLYYNLYHLYSQRLATTEIPVAKNELQETYLADLQIGIAQLQNNLQEVQFQSLQFDYGQYNSDTNQQNMDNLQAEQLQFCEQLQKQLSQQQQNTQQQIKLAQRKNQIVTYQAPAAGIVHTFKQDINKDTITWAQIDPLLNNKQPLTVQAKINNPDNSQINKGQKVLITLSHQLLKGTVVRQQDQSVTAQVKASPKQMRQLRSGVDGSGTIITGQQSWWSYLINKIFHH